MIKKTFKTCEMILSILFILFLVIGLEDNNKMAQIVNIPQIKIIVVIVTLLIFLNCNRVLGVLSILVAYEIINFSHIMMNNMNKSLENVEYSYEMNLFSSPLSMEEELIYKMNPIFTSNLNACSYNPMKSSIL